MDPLLLTYTGAVLLLALSPGADSMLVIRNVLSRGPLAGILATAGISAGLFVHATLSSLGLALILVRPAAAFETVKLAGAAYLPFLGLRSLDPIVRPNLERTAGAPRPLPRAPRAAAAPVHPAGRRRAAPLAAVGRHPRPAGRGLAGAGIDLRREAESGWRWPAAELSPRIFPIGTIINTPRRLQEEVVMLLLWLVLTQLVGALSLAAWLVLAGRVVTIVDKGLTLPRLAVIWAVWLYPAVPITGAVLAWRNYQQGDRAVVLLGTSLSLLVALPVIIYVARFNPFLGHMGARLRRRNHPPAANKETTR